MTFADEIRLATDTTDPLAYIDRVKTVVIRQLEALDETASIENTQYFNHSSVPDFIVRWPGERGERRIYLRDSYESIVAAHDGLYLTAGDPVLVSLEEPHPDFEQSLGEVDAELGTRMLITDVDAVSVITEGDRQGDSPLTQMIRANFVRGARGRIDRPVAESLIEPQTGDAETLTTGRIPEEFIAETFFEDAAFRINRTARLIERAMLINTVGEELPPLSGIVSGQLSVSEMRTVLPWLLTQEAAQGNVEFWRQIGQLMSFSDLEKIRHSLIGINVTPLISANRTYWTAKWAYAGASMPIEGDETYERRRNYWSFEQGALGVDLGDARFSVAFNGQLAPKGRSSTSSASWETLQTIVESERISRVDLHGTRRSVAVSSEQSTDVRGDVLDISRSLEDDYFVGQIAIRGVPPEGEEGDTEISVNFDSGLVKAEGGVATIDDLIKAVVGILSFRLGVSHNQLF